MHLNKTILRLRNEKNSEYFLVKFHKNKEDGKLEKKWKKILTSASSSLLSFSVEHVALRGTIENVPETSPEMIFIFPEFVEHIATGSDFSTSKSSSTSRNEGSTRRTEAHPGNIVDDEKYGYVSKAAYNLSGQIFSWLAIRDQTLLFFSFAECFAFLVKYGKKLFLF